MRKILVLDFNVSRFRDICSYKYLFWPAKINIPNRFMIDIALVMTEHVSMDLLVYLISYVIDVTHAHLKQHLNVFFFVSDTTDTKYKIYL